MFKDCGCMFMNVMQNILLPVSTFLFLLPGLSTGFSPRSNP